MTNTISIVRDQPYTTDSTAPATTTDTMHTVPTRRSTTLSLLQQREAALARWEESLAKERADLDKEKEALKLSSTDFESRVYEKEAAFRSREAQLRSAEADQKIAELKKRAELAEADRDLQDRIHKFELERSSFLANSATKTDSYGASVSAINQKTKAALENSISLLSDFEERMSALLGETTANCQSSMQGVSRSLFAIKSNELLSCFTQLGHDILWMQSVRGIVPDEIYTRANGLLINLKVSLKLALGLKELVPAIGEVFDPCYHIAHGDADPETVITEVLLPGFIQPRGEGEEPFVLLRAEVKTGPKTGTVSL